MNDIPLDEDGLRIDRAMIAINTKTKEIKIGIWPDVTEWSKGFDWTAGACFAACHAQSVNDQRAQLFIDFHTAVVLEGVPIEAAHREFLKIGEYRRCVSPELLPRP